MTTEDDFHAALDAHPEDWQTRLVFADWLDEHGDPRAKGYRALVRSRCYSAGAVWWNPSHIHGYDAHAQCWRTLPRDWWAKVRGGKAQRKWGETQWRSWPSRRAAEDAAARAFAKLPADRRAELLGQVPA